MGFSRQEYWSGLPFPSPGDLPDKPKTIKKMVIGSYISIITLNVNGLNAPTKRHRLAGQMKAGACMHFLLHHSA